MNEQTRLQRLLDRFPRTSRRNFLRMAGTAAVSPLLLDRLRASETIWQAPVQPINKARNVIFVLLAGAPSHTDTFDFKMVPGVTPEAAQPATRNGIVWPVGILPTLGGMLDDIVLVRSLRAWALVHSLAQTWTQIGRNPAAALGSIAPNIGAIVALEKMPERAPGQAFPAFLALNSDGAAGPGYLHTRYAPFKTAPSGSGLRNTTNRDGEVRFGAKWDLLNNLDGPLRTDSPLGSEAASLTDFYSGARGLMYNPAVTAAFQYTPADSARYGSTAFGNACLVAKQVLAANGGTRFIQITLGGWDMHQNIYGAGGNIESGTNIFTLGRTLDNGLATLIGDLKSAGLLDETLVVAVGEFGRTVGALSSAGGRDHFLQQSALFAGAGIRGGRAIGSTNAEGSATEDPGWSRNRDIRAEDIEATIYSAMGINWTTIRYDDPFGRGFEYVPLAKEDVYGPLEELWN